ncbi:MAG: PH domain-containing protein [Gaiellaceae bacterium]
MRPPASERLLVETHQHGIVLAGAFLRALVLVCAGVLVLQLGWPYSPAGALALALAALIGLRAVLRWDRTRIVLTTQRLTVSHGVLRRRSASVRLAGLGAFEVEQTLTGRLLGYGTLIAGELEVDYVPQPRVLSGLVAGRAD